MLQLLNRRAFVVTAHIIAVSGQWNTQCSLAQYCYSTSAKTWLLGGGGWWVVGGLMHCQCGCSPVLFPINALHDSKLWAGEWGDSAFQGECKAKAKKLKILLVHISTGCGRLLTVMARLGVQTTPLLSILRSRGHFALVKGLLCPAKQIGALVGSFWQNRGA